MTLEAGTRLGPYEVLGLAGSGGMGEVYRARDTRLGRTVALKLTAASESGDPQHRLRLEREARAIAALNHAHICAIHDVGSEGGRDFLVMEYVEGETLERRLERGPMSLAELLRAATEIAGALDAAHRAGITHRDLKPSNVMIARGSVKLLDFGVARHQPIAGPEADHVTTALASAAGALVGTVPYMAPEQLEGRAVDGRTDIFAFGALLFEMATARPAFAGTSTAALTAAILGESRPRLPESAGLPPGLGRLISICLARDPDERWQSAGDLVHALKWTEDETAVARAAGVAPSRRWIVHAAWASAVAAVVAILWFAGPRRSPGPPPNPQPVIVLMDSPLEGRVYDPRTEAAGLTNADDVTDVLRALPVGIRKENTSAQWHRQEQVIAENPDLIVSHLSCLFDQRGHEPKTVAYEQLFDGAQERLLLFFAYVAAVNPRTRFIVYSRGRITAAGGESAWVAGWEARLPALRGRLHAFAMPGGDAATFRDPDTGKLLKKRVMDVLRLETR
jgi:serine/threonine protein kinase